MKISTKHNRMKMGSPPYWAGFVAVAAVIFLTSFPISASAADISGTSRSYLTSRELTDGARILPGYEYLDFQIQNLGSDTISAHFGGWAGYDFKEKTGDNDIQYGYLSYKSKTANAMVNLGRVMVFEGVAAERVDGIYARTDLKGDFAISAFGGSPVETLINLPGNNTIYGARLSHQMPGLYRIGVSYLKEEKNSQDFREEEGIDVWVHPVNKVDITGRSNYNALTKDWMENTYNLILGPFDKLRLITEASWINYKDYFTGATMAAFLLQPGGVLDPNEKVRKLGEEIAYALTDKVNVSVDYRTYDYEIAGSAKYYGGNLRYNAASGGAGLSAHRMDGDADRNKYSEYRVYGYKKIDKMDLALDLLDVKYDAPINGVTNSYSASLAAGYDVLQNLKLGADVEYQKNPDFNKDVRAFLKAIYRFDVGSGARKGV